MIGIARIGVHIPDDRIDNVENAIRLGSTESFVEEKIGFNRLAKKRREEKSSDLCVKAFRDLALTDEEAHRVDFLCVCTQNGDFRLPHTSAVLHDKLGLSEHCAAFDISLGCSGYPYCLTVAKSFMEANDLHFGLLFTSDPYSDIISEDDRDTSLLFGDGATVTLLTKDPVFEIGHGAFSTFGNFHDRLIKRGDKPLYMNGRGIYSFVMRYVPGSIRDCLTANNLTEAEVDIYLLHQASKYVLDSLVAKYGMDASKIPFCASDYGNTISSTIPIMLRDYFTGAHKTLVLCG